MIHNFAWIGTVDHRISAAVVFFVLMLLLNKGEKRPLFPLRALGVLAAMCLASWLTRSLSDEWLVLRAELQGDVGFGAAAGECLQKEDRAIDQYEN